MALDSRNCGGCLLFFHALAGKVHYAKYFLCKSLSLLCFTERKEGGTG